MFNAFLSALSAIIILLLLSTFNLSLTNIYLGIVAALFGTIYPAYGALATSIPLSVFLCLSAILGYRLYQNNGRKFFFIISTFCISYASIVDYSNAFVLIPIVCIFLWKIKDDPILILYSIPSLIPITLLMIYNYLVFENFWVLSYSFYEPVPYVRWNGFSDSMSVSNIPAGLHGLLVSLSRGMLVLSPITLLGPLGLYYVKTKRHGPDIFVFFIMSALGVLFLSSYIMWHGGHCIGYRHILISAIILGLLSSFFYEHASKFLKISSIVVLIFSCTVGILSFFIQLDPALMSITWLGEPNSIHSNFYAELLYPFLSGSY